MIIKEHESALKKDTLITAVQHVTKQRELVNEKETEGLEENGDKSNKEGKEGNPEVAGGT